MNKLCKHGRLTTGYCEPCAISKAHKLYEEQYPPQCFAEPVPEIATNEAKVSTCTGNSMQKSDCMLHDDKTCKECSMDKPSDRQVNGSHYKSMAIQPSEFIFRNELNWYEANAVKYICRHKRKGGRVDVEKAIHYLELLLEAEYVNSAEAED